MSPLTPFRGPWIWSWDIRVGVLDLFITVCWRSGEEWKTKFTPASHDYLCKAVLPSQTPCKVGTSIVYLTSEDFLLKGTKSLSQVHKGDEKASNIWEEKKPTLSISKACDLSHLPLCLVQSLSEPPFLHPWSRKDDTFFVFLCCGVC